MNHFTIDILLEFLYEKYAITFVFCFFGSFVKEYITSRKTDSNGKKGSKFNLVKVIISSIFSTFLVCIAADFISVELKIEVYAILSIIVGIWGFELVKCLVDKKFIAAFCGSIASSFTNPILKSAAESASKTLEAQEKEESKKSNDKKDDGDDKQQTIKIEIVNK